MKIGAMMALLTAVGSAIQASGGLETQLRAVTVYVQVGFGGTPLLLCRAEGIASKMFSEAGVQIQWRSDRPRAYRDPHPIVVDISTDTPDTLHRGALAYATAHEGVHIRIFWDRIQRMVGKRLTDMLLAHVLAHEITHLLQGTNRHSPDGVMKAHWTAQDLVEMGYKPLAFDPEDVALIHYGLAHYCMVGETAQSEACTLAQGQSIKNTAVITP